MNSPTQDLTEIRKLMERSTRFISLSGLSGILAGIYALVGAWLTSEYFLPASDVGSIALTGILVLVLSLATAAGLSGRKARKEDVKIFSRPVRLLLFNLAVPLFTGGAFIFILLQKDYYDLLASVMMIFYGLSLINAAKYTADYIRTLGYLEVILGLMAAMFSEQSLLLWSVGFGWLHIVYSAAVYWKYER